MPVGRDTGAYRGIGASGDPNIGADGDGDQLSWGTWVVWDWSARCSLTDSPGRDRPTDIPT